VDLANPTNASKGVCTVKFDRLFNDIQQSHINSAQTQIWPTLTLVHLTVAEASEACCPLWVGLADGPMHEGIAQLHTVHPHLCACMGYVCVCVCTCVHFSLSSALYTPTCVHAWIACVCMCVCTCVHISLSSTLYTPTCVHAWITCVCRVGPNRTYENTAYFNTPYYWYRIWKPYPYPYDRMRFC